MTTEIRSTETYIAELRAELADCDPAMVQDALADAEEFVRAEREAMAAGAAAPDAGAAEPALAARLIARFGAPREVAEAYRENEARVRRALSPRPSPPAAKAGAAVVAEPPAAPEPLRSPAERVLGILADPHAWGSLFYMFLALGTGIVYFTWAVTGVSLSLGLAILILGVPFTLAFLASVRGISLLEGRVVETLLGERMPRRAPTAAPPGSFGARIRHWLKDRRTWTTLAYMLLQMPLGIFYFTLFTIMLALTLGLFLAPFAALFGGEPIVRIGDLRIDLPFWTYGLFWLASAIDLLIALHLARGIGRLHGKLAKELLVSRG